MVDTEGDRRWYVLGWGTRMGTSFFKSQQRMRIPRQRGYLWDGGVLLPLWLWEKTRWFSGHVYRSDGRALIKLIKKTDLSLLWDWEPRSSEGLRGAEILRREETGWIHSLENE